MTDPRIEPSVADAEKLIRKMDACTGIGAKLVLLRDFLADALQSAVAEEREACLRDIKQGEEDWQAGNCHETGCGCVTAYIEKRITARGQKETA